MNYLAENIRQRMNDMKLTQAQLAQKAGISQVTVHKLLAGKILHSSRLIDIARALESRPEWLQFGVGEPNAEYIVANKIKDLPVLKDEQVLQWIESDIDDEETIRWDATPLSVGEKSFWLSVVGDSMTSTTGVSIPDGYQILVNTDRQAKHGDFVVAKLDNLQIAFKQLIVDMGARYLKPLNGAYRMIEVGENCTILGVVLEAKVALS